MALTYFKSKDAWGLRAKDQNENLSLVFSGYLNVWRIIKESIRSFFPPAPKVLVLPGTVDVYRLFSHSAKKAWNRAVLSAVNKGSMKVGCVELFLALSEHWRLKDAFSRLGASTHDIRTLLKNYMILAPASKGFEEIKKIPFAAFAETQKLRHHSITPLMLLAAMIQTLPQEHILQAIFSHIGLTPAKLEILTIWLLELEYEFPNGSLESDLLHCCQKAHFIELHNHVSFRFDVIENALTNSSNDPKRALGLLVKAAGDAQRRKLPEIISLQTSI